MRRITASVVTGILSITMAIPVGFAATSYNTQCIQTAIEKEQGAFITSIDTYYATVRSAMISRKDALRTAWSISDSKQRRDTVRNAEKNFTTTERNAAKTRRDADRAAEKTFKSEAKLCEIKS